MSDPSEDAARVGDLRPGEKFRTALGRLVVVTATLPVRLGSGKVQVVGIDDGVVAFADAALRSMRDARGKYREVAEGGVQ
jgi:hypothetical protein